MNNEALSAFLKSHTQDVSDYILRNGCSQNEAAEITEDVLSHLAETGAPLSCDTTKKILEWAHVVAECHIAERRLDAERDALPKESDESGK